MFGFKLEPNGPSEAGGEGEQKEGVAEGEEREQSEIKVEKKEPARKKKNKKR